MSDLVTSLVERGIDPAELLKKLQAEKAKRASENKLGDYRPYSKQLDFHTKGALFRERLFLAGNQLGKTLAGGFETAMHLTGKYPEWWPGKRFDHPVVAWVGGVTGEATRDGAERILLGRAGSRGTGTIPAADIDQTSARQGVADAIATARIKYVTGGYSTVIFKSFDQGREKWQGDTIDVLWCDEEPKEEIYTEGLTRTNAGDGGKGGIAFVTFTPLKGMSKVVKRFMREHSPDRTTTTMEIEDAEHYTPQQRKKIVDAYPEHEREARSRGIPTRGSGVCFPIPERDITWSATALPKEWRRIAGLDFGWDHPTAAIWLTHDTENDVLYLTDCYRVRQQTPIVHAAAIKARGAKIPMAWPHDGLQHDKGSGEQLAQQYRQQGVAMLAERAQYADDRGNGVEAGVIDLLQRMQTGRFKVASHLSDWWEEFRDYRREEGVIVKEDDDLMSATRYAVMCLRFAKVDDAVLRYRPPPKSANASSMAA